MRESYLKILRVILRVYAYVRSKSKSKANVGPLINTSNMQVKECGDKSNILNDYCSSVFTKEKLERLPILKNKLKEIMDNNILNNVLITEKIVYTKT